VTAALELLPTTTLVGDDSNWPGVRQAVEEVARVQAEAGVVADGLAN
jgi:hypothetical protein